MANQFQPYQYPMMSPYVQQPYQRPYGAAQGYTGQIIQVNGRAGAEALQMSPNSSVYVQDTSMGNRIFLCMTDGAGYKTVRGILGVFEEEQQKQEQQNALQSIEDRLKNVEARLNEFAGGNYQGAAGGKTGTAAKRDPDD